MAKPFVILHLGLGSFHRAHQAVYLHRLIEQEAAHHAAHVHLLASRLSPPAGDRQQPDRPVQARFPERDPTVDDVVGLLG